MTRKRDYERIWSDQSGHIRRVALNILTVLLVISLVLLAIAVTDIKPLASLKIALNTMFTPVPSEQPEQNIPAQEINPVTEKASDIPNQTPPSPSPPPIPVIPEKDTKSPPVPEKSTAINIAELEKQIHNLINGERIKNGIAVLAWDIELSTVARKHSEDMIKRNFFDHVNPEGQRGVDRCRLAGITISRYPESGIIHLGCAENIFQCSQIKVSYYRNGILYSSEYYSPAEIAELAVRSWMNSPGHRENILRSYWHTEGIGIALSSNGDVSITQNFN